MTSVARGSLALLIGLVVGIAVMVFVNAVVNNFGNWPVDPREYLGFWGTFFGAWSALFAFGIALAVLRHEIAPKQAVRRHPVVWSLFFAGAVGFGVMAIVNVRVYNSGEFPAHGREVMGLSGAFFGFSAALATFAVIRTRLRNGDDVERDSSALAPARTKVGLLIAAIVAGLFGLLVLSFNLAWGFSLWSLEGAWLWPLAMVPLLVSIALFRGYLRSRARKA